MMTLLQHALPGPILADGSAGGAIWTLIMIVWVISKVAGLRKRGQTAPPPLESPGPLSSSPKPVDAELRELFESITGQKLEPARPPAPAPATPTPVQRAAPAAASPRDHHAPPPVPSAVRRAAAARAAQHLHPSLATPPRRAAAPPPPPPPTPASVLARQAEAAREAAALDETVAAERAVLASLAMPTVAFAKRNSSHALTMKLPSLRIGFGNSSLGSAGHQLTALRTDAGLRSAMVHRIVLGPPRALEPAS